MFTSIPRESLQDVLRNVRRGFSTRTATTSVAGDDEALCEAAGALEVMILASSSGEEKAFLEKVLSRVRAGTPTRCEDASLKGGDDAALREAHGALKMLISWIPPRIEG